MATGLFDMVTPQQAQQAYLDQFTTSPQQMGQQGLLQQVVSQMGNAGAGIGAGVGRLFGGMSPQEAEAQRVQGIMSGVDMTSSEGLLSAAKRFSQVGDTARAQALVGQANEVQKAEQAKAEQSRKLAAEQTAAKNKQYGAQLLSNKLGIPADQAQFIIEADPKAAIEMLDPKKDIRKVVRGTQEVFIDINDPQEKVIAVAGPTETDASGLKGLTAQLKAQQLADLQAKAAERGDKAAIAKKQDISRLARNENDAEIAINTGLLALGLAPTSAGGAFTQAAFDSIPWTDAKSLANLVESLNNEKAISTLQQLKEQSRTGATGFGALSEKELNLILAKTRKLDPTDKMFKENLKIVLDGWDKIRQESRNARLELQGVEDPLGLR